MRVTCRLGYARAVQTLVEDFLQSLRHERGQPDHLAAEALRVVSVLFDRTMKGKL